MAAAPGAARRHPRRFISSVPDADRVYQAALAAGAVSLRSPVDQPYGDREASVRDLAGNHWYIATHQEGSHVPEGSPP